MPKITKENFVEANKLRDRVSAAQEASRTAFNLLDDAFKRDDDQMSEQWQELNISHNRSLEELAKVTEEQKKWWDSLRT